MAGRDSNAMISGTRLEELLDQWEEAQARGESLSVEQLCADDPHLKETLRQQIAALERIRDKFQSQSAMAASMMSEPTNIPTAGDEIGNVSAVMSVDQLQLYATGGLGKVYCGTDATLHREVAVKFLQEQHGNRPRMVDRFVTEAEITSRLDHPNVVPVYGFGWTAGGQPFYVMRLIRGETLDAEIDRFHVRPIASFRAYQSREFRNLLQRFKDTCNAIAYAHSRGIVHLDIKPQNVLLGRYGETVVVDWGLAATVGREGRYRQNAEQTLNLKMSGAGGSSTGKGGGTPAYMSPEQVLWQPLPGPAADLFCLGATLYKICTGRPPYRSARQPKMVDSGLVRDFPLPREVQRHVPRPLQSICLKAMAMQPELRYETALDLRDEIDRYLAGSRVQAHTEGWGERIYRFMQHHRRSTAMAILLAVLLLLGSALAAWRFAVIAQREAASRAAIERLQGVTLQASARYAAEMFAGEIESRWTVLDKAASSRLLREQLLKYEEDAMQHLELESLQAWLGDQFMQYRDLNATTWFIVAADGRQLVVFPRKRTESEGENYRHRDYFHGQGRDFARGSAPDQVRPIRSPHFSVPYVSTNSHRLKVALSVPIWRDDSRSGEPLGVLGMGTELGQMKILEHAMLVDLRPDWLDGTEKRGLVLQHPELEALAESSRGNQVSSYHLNERVLNDLLAGAGTSHLDQAYEDPLHPDQRELAAAAPVIVHDWFAHNEDRVKKLGLYVIVTQPDVPTTSP